MPIVLRPPTERERRAPLPSQLAAIGRSRKWVAGAAGVFAFVGAITAALLVVCALDAWLHVGALTRAFFLTGTLAVAGTILFRRILPAFQLRTEPLDIALEL